MPADYGLDRVDFDKLKALIAQALADAREKADVLRHQLEISEREFAQCRRLLEKEREVARANVSDEEIERVWRLRGPGIAVRGGGNVTASDVWREGACWMRARMRGEK